MSAPARAEPVDGRLAVVRDGQIWTVAADGSRPARLTSGHVDGRPRWSPDGTRLAFTRVTGAVSQLWVMRADGSGQARVSPLAGAGRPDWSPDGRLLAFVAAYDGYSPAVYRVPATPPYGAARVVLEDGNDWGTTQGSSPLYASTTFGGPVPTQVSWSPDGRSLTFFNGSCYAYYERCLDSFDPVTRFTTTALGNSSHSNGDETLESADWSPDSRTLLTTEAAGGGHHLDVGLPGGTRIANAANGVYAPSGRRIAFTRVHSGVTWVWTCRTDGTQQVRVTPGSIPDWQPRPH